MLPDRPGQRSAAMGWTLANTMALAAAGCEDACLPQRWRFLPITSRKTVHGQPARHRYGSSMPRLTAGTARSGRHSVVTGKVEYKSVDRGGRRLLKKKKEIT